MRHSISSLLLLLFLVGCQPTDTEASPAPTPAPDMPTPASDSPPRDNIPKPLIKPGKITQISLEQFFILRSEDGALTVDVRRPVMFALGHIDGAINLPLTSFEISFPKHRAKLDQARNEGQVIVLYCDGENCPDAHTTAKALADRGYSTSIYRGGWTEWKEIGMD